MPRTSVKWTSPAIHTKSRSDVLRAGLVKAQSAAGRGVGAQRRGLDEAEHSTMLKWVMAGPQVLHQELAEMSTVISRVKPVLIVLETGRQIGPVTQTQTNDQRAVKACNQTDAPNLIVRGRWRASRTYAGRRGGREGSGRGCYAPEGSNPS